MSVALEDTLRTFVSATMPEDHAVAGEIEQHMLRHAKKFSAIPADDLNLMFEGAVHGRKQGQAVSQAVNLSLDAYRASHKLPSHLLAKTPSAAADAADTAARGKRMTPRPKAKSAAAPKPEIVPRHDPVPLRSSGDSYGGSYASSYTEKLSNGQKAYGFVTLGAALLCGWGGVNDIQHSVGTDANGQQQVNWSGVSMGMFKLGLAAVTGYLGAQALRPMFR